MIRMNSVLRCDNIINYHLDSLRIMKFFFSISSELLVFFYIMIVTVFVTLRNISL